MTLRRAGAAGRSGPAAAAVCVSGLQGRHGAPARKDRQPPAALGALRLAPDHPVNRAWATGPQAMSMVKPAPAVAPSASRGWWPAMAKPPVDRRCCEFQDACHHFSGFRWTPVTPGATNRLAIACDANGQGARSQAIRASAPARCRARAARCSLRGTLTVSNPNCQTFAAPIALGAWCTRVSWVGAPVSELGAWAFFAPGLAALGGLRRRRGWH